MPSEKMQRSAIALKSATSIRIYGDAIQRPSHH